LGGVVQSEIVEHPDQGLCSVFLFYQSSKRPAKIWVTFSETTIDGLHYNIWAEGYAGRKGQLGNVLKNMSVTESLIWGFVLIPMIVMSLFLLNGKGAFLIAGYNTMSKEEQAKYDEKALCRSTGRFLLWITFVMMLVPFGIHNEIIWMPFCAIGIMMASSLVYLIYVNTGNRFLKKEDVEEKRDENFLDSTLYDKRGSVQKMIGCLGALVACGCLLGVVVTSVLVMTGKIDPTFLGKWVEHPLTWWVGSVSGVIVIIVGWYYAMYRHNYDWNQSCDP
jgi:hypothetical protein